MKQLLILILIFIFLMIVLNPGNAPVGDTAAVYTSTSVTDSGMTSAQYDRFTRSGEPGTIIPGLAEGLVPQGIAWMEAEDALLISGYRTDGGGSALIAFDRSTGEIRKQVSLQYSDGRVYNGHAGGVCVTENDIYISGEQRLYRISLDKFRQLSDTASCSFEEEILVPVNASFCNCSEGVLWVGEFHHAWNYPTDPDHAVSSADGTQRAWICGYRQSGNPDFETPDFILSVTDRIQGMTTSGGAIYLSQSYGNRTSSSIIRYNMILDRDPDMTVQLGQQEVPLWILDSSCRSDTLPCPPMSEGLCSVENGIFVLFESAALPYMDPLDSSSNAMDRAFLLKDF